MLCLSRRFGERVVLFDKNTKQELGFIELSIAKQDFDDDATLLFDQFDKSIGIYRQELYERYKKEAGAIAEFKSRATKEKGLLEFISAYEKEGRVTSRMLRTIGNR